MTKNIKPMPISSNFIVIEQLFGSTLLILLANDLSKIYYFKISQKIFLTKDDDSTLNNIMFFITNKSRLY